MLTHFSLQWSLVKLLYIVGASKEHELTPYAGMITFLHQGADTTAMGCLESGGSDRGTFLKWQK